MLAGGGAAAAEYLPLRDWYDRLTGTHGPAGRTLSPWTTVYRSGMFASATVAGAVDYMLAFPPGTTPVTPAPLCVCLPGRGMPARAVFTELHLGDYAAEAIAAGAFATVRAGGRRRRQSATGTSAPRVRTGWRCCSTSSCRCCASSYGLGRAARAVRDHWLVHGWVRSFCWRPSVGRSLFCAVAVACPALWRSPGETVAGAFDGPGDWRANDVYAGTDRLANVLVRVDCGKADPFFGAAKAFAAALPNAPAGEFGTGGHNYDYWRRIAPAQVEFLSGALARGRMRMWPRLAVRRQ